MKWPSFIDHYCKDAINSRRHLFKYVQDQQICDSANGELTFLGKASWSTSSSDLQHLGLVLWAFSGFSSIQYLFEHLLLVRSRAVFWKYCIIAFVKSLFVSFTFLLMRSQASKKQDAVHISSEFLLAHINTMLLHRGKVCWQQPIKWVSWVNFNTLHQFTNIYQIPIHQGEWLHFIFYMII